MTSIVPSAANRITMLSSGGQAESQVLDFIEKLAAEHRTRILSIF